ncbi:DNA polymerase II large subunit [Candidatus Pacearchaeota archaeon]|nr:DNA polymerase II large subunit [Candidatus Pacearchaeota archaeon]
MNTQEYFKHLEKEVKKVYEIAEEARAKGLDPIDKVEIPLAMSMAEKVVGLISTIYPQMQDSDISKRILELEKDYGKLDPAVSVQIAEEIAKQKFCQFASLLEAIDAGTRVGFAYATLGVVSSPIEGLTELKIKKTRDGKEFLAAYYSGPVRSAGGTGAAFSLVILDHLREIFGFAKYDPTEEESKRAVSELTDYHERITNLQYMPTEEEILFLAKNIPIQVTGEKSEKLEVSNYKNLERIETNYLRSGYCLVIGEGIAQKAPKIYRYVAGLRKRGFKLSDWSFLEEYLRIHEKREKGKADTSPTYIKDIVAGRPIFGHPSRSGGFRFRYGRGRTSGFSATSIHPATMAITDSFIALGTQLKIEKPTKGCAVTSCDLIDGPIVKLFNGSVKKLKTKDEAKKYYSDVEEVIYLGDILFPFGDVANRNHVLIKPGYVEEWWHLDFQKADENVSKNVDAYNVSLDDAINFSEKLKVPLHPSFIFYWKEISREQFFSLIEWLKYSRVGGKLILPFNKTEQEKFKSAKRTLELLGIEHEFIIENVVINEEISKALFVNLGIDVEILKKEGLLRDFFDFAFFREEVEEQPLEIVNSLSKFRIKDKSGEFIGARMARPEKAKLRKLTGSPNVLFPVGSEGGRLRSVQAACEEGKVWSSFPLFFCENCKKETIYSSCEVCNNKCRKEFFFFETKEKSFSKESNGLVGNPYYSRQVDIRNYFDSAVEKLNLSKEEIPVLVKGVRGISSEEKNVEHLAKGILRARYDLQVNKDGTIRFDVTELPLVAFKPKEISVSVEKLRELGYNEDVYGNKLISDDQVLELKPHDILLSSSLASPDERADDVFTRIANFVDEELENFYKLDKFHNIKKKEDLIGQIGVCMAPHNCAGVICRFIGFTQAQGIFASPYMHAAIRRDCDGDEAAIMLLSDVLLNFSMKFLPSHRGGTQDAPLVLNAKIDAGEVDEQILDFEMTMSYPLELYEAAERGEHSSKVDIYTIKKALREGRDPFINLGFTHDTSNINDGVACSSYKILATMKDKVEHQMALAEKLRSADTSDTARLIIERHFIRDTKGNLRNFSIQEFRCVVCNEIMRRPPLSGVCVKCKGKIIFTVHEGGIKKYLDIALELAKKYELSSYLKQNLDIIKRTIDSIFGKELEKQETISKWF